MHGVVREGALRSAEQALALKEAQDEEGKAYCKALHLEIEVKKLKEEVVKLEAAAKRRRGAAPEPEKEEEESELIKVFKFFAEDRREITAKLAKMDKTLQGVVAALGFVANAKGGAAKSISSDVTSSCGQKRKRDGRGGDRKSALYLLQCRMGLIPLAEAIKK